MKKTLLMIVLMPLMVLADMWTDPSTGIKWTYTVQSDGTVLLGGGYNSPAVSKDTTGTLTIPRTINSKSVTSIGDYAFSGRSGLTSVTIPSSVTSIGDSAFYYCTGLTSVTIPEGMMSIGSSAFYWCVGLTSITIPKSVTSVGAGAFYGCSGLSSITLPFVGSERGIYRTSSKFRYIFSDEFSYVPSSLKTVVITDETKIFDNAFQDCGMMDAMV